MESDAELVRAFTVAADQPAPNYPERMSKEEVHFLVRMIIDETLELMATVSEPDDAKLDMIEMISQAKSVPTCKDADPVQVIAEQADSGVDIYYYFLNAMCKKGVNVSKIFKLVHEANMAKRDPETQKFIKRADGKILKPSSFVPANVEEEIRRQMKDGAF